MNIFIFDSQKQQPKTEQHNKSLFDAHMNNK